MQDKMTPTATRPNVTTRAKLFRAFSDVSRLSILEALLGGRCNVGDIVEETGLSQPNASNHLACLLGCGLVVREQEGRFVFYSLSHARVAELLAMADHLLDEVALGIDTCHRH